MCVEWTRFKPVGIVFVLPIRSTDYRLDQSVAMIPVDVIALFHAVVVTSVCSFGFMSMTCSSEDKSPLFDCAVKAEIYFGSVVNY